MRRHLKNEEFVIVVEKGRTESDPLSERVDVFCMNFPALFLRKCLQLLFLPE